MYVVSLEREVWRGNLNFDGDSPSFIDGPVQCHSPMIDALQLEAVRESKSKT